MLYPSRYSAIRDIHPSDKTFTVHMKMAQYTWIIVFWAIYTSIGGWNYGFFSFVAEFPSRLLRYCSLSQLRMKSVSLSLMVFSGRLFFRMLSTT